MVETPRADATTDTRSETLSSRAEVLRVKSDWSEGTGLAVLAYPDQQEFLKPGDRVDVIASRQGYKAGGKSELTALTLLQDLLVLRAGPPEGNEEWGTVQLMLTPEQAKILTRAVADDEHLSLPTRASGDRATRAVEPSKMSRRL